MTKPNDSFSLKSDAQAMEDAAENWVFSGDCEVIDTNYAHADSFKAGWQAARAKQSVEVEDALSKAHEAIDAASPIVNATSSIVTGQKKAYRLIAEARQALARYKESGK